MTKDALRCYSNIDLLCLATELIFVTIQNKMFDNMWQTAYLKLLRTYCLKTSSTVIFIEKKVMERISFSPVVVDGGLEAS